MSAQYPPIAEVGTYDVFLALLFVMASTILTGATAVGLLPVP